MFSSRTHKLFAAVALCLSLGLQARGEVEVFFPPEEDARGEIITALNSATVSVYVQAYHLSDPYITNALIGANNRQVKVFVLIDWLGGHQKYTTIHRLHDERIPVRLDKQSGGIAHNKVMIIDDKILFTGSFNFTKNAQERNAENLLKITVPYQAIKEKRIKETWEYRLIEEYRDNFYDHLGDSVFYDEVRWKKQTPDRRRRR